LNDVTSVTFKETAKIVARVEPDRGRAQHSECHVYLKVSRPFQLRAHECIGPKGDPHGVPVGYWAGTGGLLQADDEPSSGREWSCLSVSFRESNRRLPMRQVETGKSPLPN